jgi:LPS sulfotransferase NodH
MSMGIFGLWLMWRMKDLLEQIRHNQLTPAERAAEDTARAKEEMTEYKILLIILSPLLVALLIFTVLSYK